MRNFFIYCNENVVIRFTLNLVQVFFQSLLHKLFFVEHFQKLNSIWYKLSVVMIYDRITNRLIKTIRGRAYE